MPLRFDLDSRIEFLPSLLDLGDEIPELFFAQLAVLERKTWSEFVRDHHWAEVHILPIDSFPGAPDYHSFEILIDAQRSLTIVGFPNSADEVFCVVATSMRYL